MTDNLAWLPVTETPHLSAREAALLQQQVETLVTELSSAWDNNELMREELDNVVARITDVSDFGWVEMTAGSANSGLSLATLKRISEQLRDMTETNPLLKRGHQLRRDYVYAKGMDIEILPVSARDKVKRAMQEAYNYELFFSEEAHDTLMKTRYTDGNRFTLVNKKTGQSIHVPLAQIGNAILDPLDASRVQYIQRNVKDKSMWFATDAVKNPASSVKAGGATHTINKDWVMIHKAYNRPVGATWGLPDAMAAYLWVLAYSNYLKDNAALVKALSRIAVKVSGGTRKAQTEATKTITQAQRRGAGQTAVTGNDVKIEAMGQNGSGVNFNNGRPLAAMVATSLGVSIVALLSDPGTGGSYGVAETLDPPTTLLAMTLQASEADYYRRLLMQYGANRDTEVRFPVIDRDPAYRVLQNIFQGVAQGVLSRKEARKRVAELLDFVGLDAEDLPEPDGFNSWTDPDASAQPTDPTPRQGNSGAAGSVDQGTNNDARDNGEYS